MKAGIVGCGVAGMASAIALARRGVEVTLFEAFEKAQPLGSGLLLQPSGLAALRALGLDEQARAAGARVDRLDGRDLSGRKILSLEYDRWRPGTHGVGIHRAALFDLLMQAVIEAGVQVRTGQGIARIDRLERPRFTTVHGEVCEDYDLVLVADGSASGLRSQVRPRARAPVYPWGAVWANVADRENQFGGVLSQIYHGTEVMIGVLPIGKGQVSLFWSLPVAEQDQFFHGDFESWKERVTSLWPRVGGLVAQLGSPAEMSRALYRDVTVGRWSEGAVLLIGDAAHGTSPQLGQGANLALIDAVELGLRLKGPIAPSLVRYQRARRLQVSLYQVVSRGITPMFQSHSRSWAWVRRWLFAPLTQAPILRWFVAGGLTGSGRLGITPKSLRI